MFIGKCLFKTIQAIEVLALLACGWRWKKHRFEKRIGELTFRLHLAGAVDRERRLLSGEVKKERKGRKRL